MVFTGNENQELPNADSKEDPELLSANRLFFVKQYPDALKKYSHWLNKHDNNPDVFCRAGICKFHAGEMTNARELLDKALQLDEKHILANKWKGNVLLKLGDQIEARSYLNKAIPLVKTELIPQNTEDKRDTGLSWGWLTDCCGKPIDKKGANKFFLACLVDYQQRAEDAWEKAKRFAEIDLGDPEDLWHEITKNPLSQWEQQDMKLHRYPVGHRNVWIIGKRIVDEYDGDVRKTWLNQSPVTIAKNVEAVA